jgi:hypothetical protein
MADLLAEFIKIEIDKKGGWPTFEIWVLHLRDGLIVTEVGLWF